MKKIPEKSWESVTWEGSRREQLRHTLRLTVRERLQATEELSDIVRKFQEMRESGKFRDASE